MLFLNWPDRYENPLMKMIEKSALPRTQLLPTGITTSCTLTFQSNQMKDKNKKKKKKRHRKLKLNSSSFVGINLYLLICFSMLKFVRKYHIFERPVGNI